MKGLRSHFYTSYDAESAMLPTITQKIFMGIFLLWLFLLPLGLAPGWMGIVDEPVWFRILARVCMAAVAGLGLNMLTGVAGQVSLGHSFFMGLGAYTAILLGSEGVGFGAETGFYGFDLPMWIWLPAAAVVPAIVGAIIAPIAVRVRGLYLAFVTLGLVFIGQYIFRNIPRIAGDAEGGRAFPHFEFQLWREDPPLLDFEVPWTIAGREVHEFGMTFYAFLIILIVGVILHKNILRTRTGRAWASIRDRDIAAEVMGIPEARYKTLAFAISSGFAGVAGAMLAILAGNPGPATWDLFLAVLIIALILIGGAGTTVGVIFGALFVVLLPELVEGATQWLAGVAKDGVGFGATIADIVVSTGPADSGLISTVQNGPGLSVFDFNAVLYGVFIIVFLIFEPLGLYGIWVNIRNYWKGWPFTY